MSWVVLQANGGFNALVGEYGIAAAVIAFVLGASSWVLHRLFNANNGIITEVTKRHIEFLDQLKHSHGEHLKIQQAHTRILEGMTSDIKVMASATDELVDMHQDDDTTFSTRKLHEYGIQACDLFEMVCVKMEIQEKAKPLIKVMKRTLRQSSVPDSDPIKTDAE